MKTSPNHATSQHNVAPQQRSFTKRVVAVMVVMLLLITAYYGANFGYVYYQSTTDQQHITPKPQAIVVLGAAQYRGRPSPVYQSRLDHAYSLHTSNVAPLIVLTGGSVAGEQLTEGIVGYKYLQNKGVPEANLLAETDGHSTYQSLLATKRFLKKRGVSRIMLVTDSWHMGRAKKIATYVGFEAYGSPVQNSRYSSERALQEMGKEAFGICVGDIIGYWRLDRITNTQPK